MIFKSLFCALGLIKCHYIHKNHTELELDSSRLVILKFEHVSEASERLAEK